MRWRLLSTCCLVLQLLQLLALAPCCLAGPFDSYIINPKSYLDVTRPAARSDTAAGADAPPSSCPDSCQPAAQISSSSRSAGAKDLAAQQSRGLQQAANPARLLPPYNVCVSSWAPMVRCTPGADQSEFKGEATLCVLDSWIAQGLTQAAACTPAVLCAAVQTCLRIRLSWDSKQRVCAQHCGSCPAPASRSPLPS